MLLMHGLRPMVLRVLKPSDVLFNWALILRKNRRELDFLDNMGRDNSCTNYRYFHSI